MVVTMEPINNDELAAFVTSTLNAIAIGVESASTTNFAFVVPNSVSFEVAVRATKGSEAGGGFKLQVFSAEGKRTAQDEEVSRITFEVGVSKQLSKGPLNTSSLTKGIV